MTDLVLSDIDAARRQVVESLNVSITETQAIAKDSPDSFVVADRGLGYSPVVERDGGYALLAGPVAVFHSEFNAERVAYQMQKTAPPCLRERMDLGAMKASTWAVIRCEELRRLISVVQP
jgi:hypothetical protein